MNENGRRGDAAPEGTPQLTQVQHDALEVIYEGSQKKYRVYKGFWAELEAMGLVRRKGTIWKHYELTERGKQARNSRLHVTE